MASPAASIVLYIFCLPFCAAGLWCVYLLVPELSVSPHDWKRIVFLGVGALTFGGVGFGVLAAARYGRAEQVKEDTRKATHPTQPWMWPAKWAGGRVQSNTRSNLYTAWGFATFWNLISTPLLIVVSGELEKNPVAAVGFLFPIVGVGLLVWAVMVTLRYRRFGPSWFEMTPLPASPGARCSGMIHTRLDRPRGGEARTDVVLKLTCLRRVITGSGKNRSTKETILWREEHQVSSGAMFFTPTGTSIPVQFSLPPDALETTTTDQSEGILWVLTAEAALPGVNLNEDFDVPVYPTGAEPIEAQTAFASTFAAAPIVPVTADGLARAGISVRPTPQGTEYHFAAGRNPSFAIGLTAFLLIWSGAIWLQLILDVPWIFPLVFGLFELLLIVIAADLWLGSTTVTIGSDTIRRRHALLGIGATRSLPVADIAKLELTISMQTSGRAGTPYYEIRATCRNGRRTSFGTGIKDKHQAEWLREQMAVSIGIRGG
jgi:hypothetical protein